MRIAPPQFPLRRFLSRPAIRRVLGVAGWAAVGLYFAFALLLLALRYAVLPQIENYRGDIEAAAARALQRPVAIGAIDAGWAGLRPRLTIRGFEIRDAAGRPALGFDHVEAELSWASLWHFDVRLHRLEIVAPDLDIRRDAGGRYFIAGLELSGGEEPGRFDDWLLAQERVVVRNAAIRWHDELRAAPTLSLRQVNFDLRNSGNHHRFGFTAEPPRELAARLDLRGDFRGRDLDALSAWRGELYGELDYADLAIWRQWVDYPVDLPRGSGGLRLWLSFQRLQPTAVTADVRLADVAVRLAPELPLLELDRLEGRLAARQLPDRREVRAKALTLATREGVRIEPMDFDLRQQLAAAELPAAFELTANVLDLGALAALAAHLPLAEDVRQQLAAYAPRGRLQNLALAWQGDGAAPASWRAKGDFTGLGLRAHESVPGFAGLSGHIEGDHKKGRLSVDSQGAALELPRIFADPHLALESLTAQATWQAGADGLVIELAQAAFQNADAAGEISGRYRPLVGTRGSIDLSAKLTRAAGNAVWRYMPLKVNQDVRDWLKAAIRSGQSDETTLRLKGDLADFPFQNGKGIFQVKGRFQGGTLRYAPSWPEIQDIDGELLFEGVRMVIDAKKGRIMGVGIGPVRAEIADLDASEELMTLNGQAAGATADFLRFIEASPVGERIDHFTADMTATGNGELQLRLDMPLRDIDRTQVDGRYRFVANRLVPEPGMPPLTDVNGELRFSADQLQARKIRAAMFGMPMTVDIATVGDGSVNVKAVGSATASGLRQQFGPLFGQLTGMTTWGGTVRVRKKTAELRIESNLQGMASSLPEPFNKTTNETMALVIERKPAAGGRDLTHVSLGAATKASLLRRNDAGQMVIERGVIAVGTPPRLPERGVALAVKLRQLNVDHWRRLFEPDAGAAAGPTAGGSAALPISQIDLRTDELTLYGRTIAALHLNAQLAGRQWKAEVKSRDAAGQLAWDGQGAGRLTGRLTHLTIPEAPATKADVAAPASADEMPSIDLAVDRFSLHGKELGRLNLKADNARDSYWNAQLEVRNDDATLSGEGRWRPSSTAPETQLDFKLVSRNIERLLDRLGYVDAVRRGTAQAEGSLSWSGPPTAIDYRTLNGQLKFEAANGQFNKLEPGVGRLLGVLSLQSLPRRLTLDFRDIFSEGFAFDAIAGQATVTRGIMETNDLRIAGPAAKVLMTGSVNLGAETQNLRVRVAPTVSDSIVTGVLLANPATGAAAWVFNKLFGNPFDQAFAFEYAVTGSWADPKVEKLGGPAPEKAAARDDAP